MRPFLLLSIFLVFAASCLAHADIPAAADTPGLVSVPNVFQYVAPAGWQIVNIREGQFPAALEKKGTDIAGLITVNMDTADAPLSQWCRDSLAKNTRL
ncbi:MAG TPA: hypothetical protein VHY09_08335, partial [Candidatus Methylacidiphilales bacterium]|nr:hypothetical protein [Candidatus Methylacidiphilales bacterium]